MIQAAKDFGLWGRCYGLATLLYDFRMHLVVWLSFDWPSAQDMNYPCQNELDCIDGYSCLGGTCVADAPAGMTRTPQMLIQAIHPAPIQVTRQRPIPVIHPIQMLATHPNQTAT